MKPTTELKGGRALETPEGLATPVEFEGQRGFRFCRRIMQLLVVLAAGAVLWAAIAPIRELSLARGQLVPVSQIRPVQHLEGGMVEDILVEQGQVVEKDQPLMRLQEAISDSDLATLRVRAHNLALLKHRLEALLTGRAADFKSLGKANPALTADHQQAYQLQLDHRAKERTLLLTRIAHRKAEIASLQNEIETQRKLVDIQHQQLDMRRTSAVGGNTSKKQVLDTETAFERSRAMLQTSEGKLTATQEALQEAEAALAESDAQAHRRWSEELAKASGELVEVQESIRKHADRVERLTIRAPIRGRVQQVLQRSPGEVVRPGDTMARIVPLGDALVAEVFVKPEDIAAVKLNDKADLKVTAYDFSKYGKIKGEVSFISTGTVENDDKRSYYKVLISFEQDRSDRFAAEWQLEPGMTVDAEIISGSKSLLQYLLKPIFRGVDVASPEH